MSHGNDIGFHVQRCQVCAYSRRVYVLRRSSNHSSFFTASLRPGCVVCRGFPALIFSPWSCNSSSVLHRCRPPLIFCSLSLESLVNPSILYPSLMEFATAYLPKICVSLAPEEPSPADPYSPFTRTVGSKDDDGFRLRHLTPPPISPKFMRPFSPLRPSESAPKGLERDRFEVLLKASRERSSGGARQTQDLRKELALKATQNKQGV